MDCGSRLKTCGNVVLADCNIPKPEDHSYEEKDYLELNYADRDEYNEDEDHERQEDEDDDEVEGLYNDDENFDDLYLKSSRGQLSIGKAAKKLPGLVVGIGAKVCDLKLDDVITVL